MTGAGERLRERVRAVRRAVSEALGTSDGATRIDAQLGQLERLVGLVSSAAVSAHEESERRTADLSVIRRASALFSSVFDLERLCVGLLELVGEAMPVSHGLLYLTDQRGQLTLEAVHGRQLDSEARAVASWAASLALERGETTAVDDSLVHRQLGDLPGADRVRAMLSAPLVVFGIPVGVLQIAEPEPGRLGAEDHRLLGQLAELAALAIHQARLCSLMIERGHELDGLARAQAEQLAGVRSALTQSERLACLATLAGGIAEEVRNPLSYVLSDLRRVAEFANDLAADVPPLLEAAERACDLPASADPSIERARRAAHAALAERVGDPIPGALLNLRTTVASVEEGLGRLVAVAGDLQGFVREEHELRESTELDVVVEGALRAIESRLGRHQRIERHLEVLPRVAARRLEIAQALLHLLRNALEALDERGVVRVATGCEGAFVWIEVHDDGPGVSPRDAARIFDAFYTTKGRGRTGLGLSIAQQVADEHGGRLELRRSEYGACFRIWIPVPTALAEASLAQSSGTGGS